MRLRWDDEGDEEEEAAMAAKLKKLAPSLCAQPAALRLSNHPRAQPQCGQTPWALC
jgi:hypothetical protein